MATKKKPLFDNLKPVRLPGAELHRGDCLAVLPSLAGPFDAVVTDPPYSSGGQSKGDRARSTGDKYLNNGSAKYPDFLGDTKDQRSYMHWSALWMSLCFERLVEGGLMIVFSDWRQLPVTTDALQAAGFTWRGIAVWDKTGGARHYEDSQLRDEVRALLSSLSVDHPAVVAFGNDAPTMEISRLLDGAAEADILRQMLVAHEAWRRRGNDKHFAYLNPWG